MVWADYQEGSKQTCAKSLDLNLLFFGIFFFILELTDVSLQTLAIILNYSSRSDQKQMNETVTFKQHKNVFISYLQGLKRNGDFQLLISAATRLLNNPIEATQTYLPGSRKKVACYPEVQKKINNL